MSSPFVPSAQMIALFKKDVQSQLATLKECIIALSAGGQQKGPIWQKISAVTNKMRGAGLMLKLSRYVDLVTAARDLSVYHEQNPSQEVLNHPALIDQTVEWISSFLSLDNTALIERGMQGDQTLDNLLKYLKVPQADSSIEQKKEPPQAEPFKGPPQTVLAQSDKKKEETTVDPSMMELFKVELENQLKLLNHGLLQLEQSGGAPEIHAGLMRAAHSLKGAARVVQLKILSEMSHALEDCFVGIQKGELTISPESIDLYLAVLDLISELNKQPIERFAGWIEGNEKLFSDFTNKLHGVLKGEKPQIQSQKAVPVLEKKEESQEEFQESVVRVTAEGLTRLMGLAGESLVETRWLYPFKDALLRLKKSFNDVSQLVDSLRNEALEGKLSLSASSSVQILESRCADCRDNINTRLNEIELYINRNTSISDRLYHEVIQNRMRAFVEGVEHFPRMVRDVARQLNKKVTLEIKGKETLVDRDILEKLEGPLGHLLRNSIDHGIESPEVRLKAGKSEEGKLTLTAEHTGGMLTISLKDDGAGIDVEKIRAAVQKKGLAPAEVVAKLSQNELIEFIFLPGFSSTDAVTNVSGRGVGLDVVQKMVSEVSGQLVVNFVRGHGTEFILRLPLTLSVMRSLVVEVSGEYYAFPLTQIERALLVPHSNIKLSENRQYFTFEERNIGLTYAQEVMELPWTAKEEQTLSVVVLRSGSTEYGFIVDSFVNEKEIVVQDLDRRLGKIPNISAGAFLEDGLPLLIFDVDNLISTIDQHLNVAKRGEASAKEPIALTSRKLILVADDSTTVRELECKVLEEAGYEVEGVVNGQDAWNALRLEKFDMLITDVDMPYMNGIELVKAIRSEESLKELPIIMISYKDSEEDRRLGTSAGANIYLTKGEFTNKDLLLKVDSLIGASTVEHENKGNEIL